MFKPLQGVRIVDLSQVLAGPFATHQLGLMGAEILKIEKPGEGDWTRRGGPLPELSNRNMALAYVAHNAGKKSVALDLKKPDDLAQVKQLIASADVFVENFKPGVAGRLGLGFDEVRTINPTIVYCSISAYGQDGPLSHRPAYDHVIQGMCGVMLTTGAPGSGPNKVGAPYIDYATGMNAVSAILAGLLEVKRSGQAVMVDVAMLDTALMLMSSLMTTHKTTGWLPRQSGNEAWSAAPASGAFDTADGVLMLAANNDAQLKNLCQAIGREDILHDSRWQSAALRQDNFQSLRDTLKLVFLERSAAHWEDVLDAAQVPAARVRGLDEVLREEQIQARGILSIQHVDGHEGPIYVPGLAFKANGANAKASVPAPTLGADTKQILAELAERDPK